MWKLTIKTKRYNHEVYIWNQMGAFKLIHDLGLGANEYKLQPTTVPTWPSN